jgi:hypothetical protein
MSDDLRRLALRLKVIEVVDGYYRMRRQLAVLRQWRRQLIQPN